MDLDFFLRLSLVVLVFLICFRFRKENMRKGPAE
jgi:hypothetical protein